MSIRSRLRHPLGDWPRAVDERIQTVMSTDAPLGARIECALAFIREQITREGLA